MKEDFRPIKHTEPKGLLGKILFFLRMLLDFQFQTIYLDLKKQLPYFKGEVLDVGCGYSPYRFLLSKNETTYYGIDTIESDKFDYNNKDIIHFDGGIIPFNDNKFDCIICTEVLEHVFDYQLLIDEIYRVMKVGSIAIFTIPWSARFHYIPFDYFRFTPSSIEKMFSLFKNISIKPRGTDVTSLVAKFVVIYFRNLNFSKIWSFILLPFWIILLPFLIITLIIGILSVFFRIGSDTDPLGYTILVEK